MAHDHGHQLHSGQALTQESLSSGNDRFTLVHQGDGNLVLYRNGDDRQATWSSGTYGSSPGRTVLQTDGNLVVYDADGDARWASGTEGRPVTRLTVQDDGDLVLTGDDGQVYWQSGTAMDWITHLDIDEAHCVTFVRGVDEREALLRLGAPAAAIRPMTWTETVEESFQGGPGALKASAVAVRYGEWVLLVEVNGAEGTTQAEALSADGGEVAASFLSVNYDQRVVYARDGVVLVDYDEGYPQENDFAVLGTYFDQVGRHRFEDPERDPTEDDDDLERADLSLVQAIVGVQPKPRDFDGPLLGAIWETPLFARLREAMAAQRAAGPGR